jgi:hypothetical protein
VQRDRDLPGGGGDRRRPRRRAVVELDLVLDALARQRDRRDARARPAAEQRAAARAGPAAAAEQHAGGAVGRQQAAVAVQHERRLGQRLERRLPCHVLRRRNGDGAPCCAGRGGRLHRISVPVLSSRANQHSSRSDD